MLQRLLTLVVATTGGLLLAFSRADSPEHHTTPFAFESINTDLSDYVWPTDAGNIGTSTFGEYRRTHFHGGIDISTGNGIGYRVFAVRDGYVARVRVSPTGYGKMLYVRHEDGYYSTYAHLSHFNAEIDAFVLREQLKQEAYPVDIECSTNRFPVKKGELIAYTGDTGVGTPHLHFEIRDENLEPINPLLCTQFSFPDHIAPVIKKIAISTLGDYSTIGGTPDARVLKVHPVKKNVYRVTETIQVTGDLGFGVSASDMSNGSRFRHGVYSHKLFLDDTLMFTVELDRVPGKNAHEIGLYYDRLLQEQGRGRFEKLYAESPSSLLFYSPRHPNAGVIHTSEFAEGPHTFRIVSTDFNENSSEVTGKLIFNHPPDFELNHDGTALNITLHDLDKVKKILLFTKRNGSDAWTTKTMTPTPYAKGNVIRIPDAANRFDVAKVVAENAWGSRSLPRFCFLRKPNGPQGSIKIERELHDDLVRIRLHATGEITDMPKLVVYEGTSKRNVALTALDINSYMGTFRPLDSCIGIRRLTAEAEVNGRNASAVEEFDLYPIVAGKSGTLTFDDGRLTISYDSASVFKTVFMRLEMHGNSETSYTLLPENTILKGNLKVTVLSEHPDQGQGLFFSGIGGWELLDRTSETAKNVLVGTITRTLGELTLENDDTPPTIWRFSISRASRRPTISFRFADNFSGVEYKELKTYIDGTVVIPEIDGEHRRVTYTPAQPLERGSHRLTIRIMDKMGNSNHVEHQFSIR